jgi:hypothetical protein
MDKVSILCNKDKAILHEFSNRYIEKLNGYIMFKLIRPFILGFMEENVQKEITKDRMIIECAVSAFGQGQNAFDLDLDEIFERTKEIDSEFIKKISSLPIYLDVRYEEIESVRKERIQVMARTVFELLGHWNNKRSFIAVVMDTYTEDRFRNVMYSILHLYNLETEVLGNSIIMMSHIPGSKYSLAHKLYKIMEETAVEVVLEYAYRIYKGACLPCQNQT